MDDRRMKLLAISENDSYKLNKEDWYDRIRYKREEEGMARLRNMPKTEIKTNGASIKPFQPEKGGYKDWILD